jgi:dethiobiotin synthetase
MSSNLLLGGGSPSGRNPMDARGLIVTGTHPKCGKTIACAGLAGVLNELGFHAQAMKPLAFQPRVSLRKGYEQAFFDRVIPPWQMVDVLTAEAPRDVTPVSYQRLLEICRKRVYPYLLESPGNAATPIRFSPTELLDSADLAQALGLQMLVVTSKQPDIIGALAPVFAYLWSRDAKVAGWLAVETSPVETPDWDNEILYLRAQYDVPFLGEIPYSPSISVETLQQGNLLRSTEMGVDLLPIQQALELLLPF